MKTIHRATAFHNLLSPIVKSCRLSLLAATFGIVSTQALAGHNHIPNQGSQSVAESAVNKFSLQQQTMSLSEALNQARHKQAAKQNPVTQSLLDLAKARQVNQYRLLKTDPKAVLHSLLPAAKRAGLPEQVQNLMAQPVEKVGKLELIYVDTDVPAQSHIRYFVIEGNQSTELFLPANTNSRLLQSGDKVSVKGWQFNSAQQSVSHNRLLVNQDISGLEVLAAGSQGATSTSTTSVLSGTTGEQKVLVLLLNFQDNAAAQPWSLQEVEQMVFGQVNDYYQETSYGQTWLSGDVRGYYTLPVNTSCDYFGIDSYAQQAAIDNGIDLNQYQRLIYMLPENESCGWRGQGTVGGNPSRAWLNGELNLMTIGHELGHNLGLKHAKELSCGSGYISEDCVAITYGDTLDIMGKSEAHFNVFNKERLGWLTPERGEIITADADGSYMLEPYEINPAGVAKGLKVRRGTDPVTGEPLWYYLEYRQPFGFDSFLAGKAVTDGVLVHLNNSAEDIESSQLLDMTPKSALYDLDDAALVSGQSYSDANAGVSITTEWADNSAVSIDVSYVAQVCTHAVPGLSLDSDASVWAEPGDSVTYSLTVTNQDSLECASSDFLVSAQLPQGWNASQQTINLAPGESGSLSLTITSAPDAIDGFYDINISSVSSSDSHYQNSLNVSYVVEAPVATCLQANPSWILNDLNSVAVEPGTSVTYQGVLTNNDSATCQASTFDIAASLPANWSFSAPSTSLSPSESQVINVTVASPTDAATGIYDFSLFAFNRNNSGYQASVSTSYSVVEPAPSCILAAPVVVVSNPVSDELTAGSEYIYQLTVTNENQDCDNATYSLTVAAPIGWVVDSAQINLASGASKSLTISVISSQNATVGNHNLTVTVQDNDNSGYQAMKSLIYRVAAEQNNAPVATSDILTLTDKSVTYINVLSNDTDPDGDAIVISAITQGAKGEVQVMGNGQIQYTPAKNFKNGDSFSYTISDGELESTTFVTVVMDSGNTSGDSTTDTGNTNKGKGKK